MNNIVDARVKMLFLIIANIMYFTVAPFFSELLLISLIVVILLLHKKIKLTLMLVLFYIFILVSLNYMSYFPNWFIQYIGIFFISLRRLAVFYFCGSLLFFTTSSREIISTMYKMKFPNAIVMSIAVGLRYFPALKEDISNVNKASKLRGIVGIKRITGFYMPVLASASRISDEITEAAITRGIENPCKKTCMYNYKLKVTDYLIMLIGIAILVSSFIIEVSLW